MHTPWERLWVLVIAAAALSGWWLSMRPGASYRGVASAMSVLVLLLAVLMAALAVCNQG